MGSGFRAQFNVEGFGLSVETANLNGSLLVSTVMSSQ
jgi:hypothetical protein